MQRSKLLMRTTTALGLLTVLTLLIFNVAARPVAAGATITVNTKADTVADDGKCSLREAIVAANADSASGATTGECGAGNGSDQISFSLANPFTITLDSQLPAVTTVMTITGDGAADSIIEADTCDPVNKPGGCIPASYRVMEVAASGTLTLDGVTVRHGYVDNKLLRGGALAPSDGGAGIYNAGTLSVVNSTVANNAAYNAHGGGIRSLGPLTINNSTFSGNLGFGGGGIAHAGSTLTVTGSTFSGNRANSGGAINTDDDDLDLTGSTITGNTAEYGAGIFGDTVTVTDSTITDNEAAAGGAGGIYGTTITVIGSTISGNSDLNFIGGIYGNTVTVTESTVAENTSAGGTGGISAGTVIVTDSTVSGNTGGFSGAGGIYGTEVTLTRSTVSDNTTEFGFGGGVFSNANLKATNSTISGNSANYGGGIYLNGTLTLTNSTFTGNEATTLAGGVYIDGVATLTRNVISGNSAPDGAEVYSNTNDLSSAASNVYGYDGLTSAQAFVKFTPGVSDVILTSDNGGVPLADILSTTLADNGGPTQTHALPAGSPAIDIGPTAACAAAPVDGVDQRDEDRSADGNGVNSADECDSGAFERQPATVGSMSFIITATPADDHVFHFTDNIAAPNAFTLQDPSNDTKLFSDVAAGTYTLTEVDSPGWPLQQVTCNVEVDNVGFEPNRDVFVTFTLPAGYDGYCTLTSVQCQPGTYDSGAATCDPAEPGHYVAVAGATMATPCSPGSYQPQPGQTSCLLADPGFYVDVSGSAVQFKCPDGTTSGPGATFCTATGDNLTYLPVAFRP